MCSGLHVKYPLFLSEFNETWIFSSVLSKNPQIWNFVKIHPVGAELFHADRRTDRTKLVVAFRNFANAPKTTVVYSIRCPINSLCTLSAVQWWGKEGRHAVLFVYTDLWPLWEGWKVKGSGVTDTVRLFRRGYTYSVTTDLSENINRHVKWDLRTALFWIITQRVVVISNRRFGTTHRFSPQGIF